MQRLSSRRAPRFQRQMNVLPLDQRTSLARQLSEGFLSALAGDLYPDESTETIFGVAMGRPTRASGGLPIGQLVYNCWSALYTLKALEQDALVSALVAGRLPQFFEEAVREQAQRCDPDALLMSVSRAFEELVERQFEGIKWDERIHAAVAGKFIGREAAAIPLPQGPPAPAAPARAAASAPSGERGDPKSLVGRTVVLDRLSKASLNGAVGSCRGFDAASGRYEVLLTSPPEAVSAHPHGLKVKPENIFEASPEVASAAEAAAATAVGRAQNPPQQGIVLRGWDAEAAAVSHADAAACSSLTGGWRRCPVPTLLGIPIAVLPLVGGAGTAQGRVLDEVMGVGLMIDPVTGFAPTDILMNGLGRVLIARTDGVSFTTTELVRTDPLTLSPRSAI